MDEIVKRLGFFCTPFRSNELTLSYIYSIDLMNWPYHTSIDLMNWPYLLCSVWFASTGDELLSCRQRPAPAGPCRRPRYARAILNQFVRTPYVLSFDTLFWNFGILELHTYLLTVCKEKNYFAIRKLKKFHHSIHNFCEKYFSRAKIEISTWQVNVQTLDRVSEFRAHYPNP